MVRRVLIGLATLGSAAVLAGCGGGSGSADDRSPVVVEASDTAYAMPERIVGGVVAMRFRNSGSQPHEFALGRVDDGHDEAEITAAVRDLSGNGEPPAWLHDIAGPPILTPGAEITITRTLAPGTYVFFDAIPDTRGIPGVRRGLVKVFRVEGDSGARLPAPDAVITAERSRYRIPPLNAGTRTVELRNRAGAGRGFLLGTLNPGKTEADINRWGERIGATGRLPEGPVPATFLGAMQTIPSGSSVFITLTLEAGREYAISDDESGTMARFTPR